MVIFKQSADIQKWLIHQRNSNKKIGFVPTMGALHAGHISLIFAARQECEVVVCSIFVNPTQFNDKKDFEKYPSTIEADILLLEESSCDVLFLPSVSDIYPKGTAHTQNYPLGYLETVLEGSSRPGHFQGVCMVVERLLMIVNPNHLYLGQKDFQQCMVISKLVELMGKNDERLIKVCPTLREVDGLAMSSRNMRLTMAERQLAPTIYNTLLNIKEEIEPGNLKNLLQNADEKLRQKGFKPDYVQLHDANTLKEVQQWDGKQPLVALIAAWLNDIRLIDNLLINE